MSKYIIQLNFKDKYDIIDQIGKGSFSKVDHYLYQVYHVKHVKSKK